MPAKNYGIITFRNARASGVVLSQLGSGTYDHLGAFGPGDTSSAVEVGSFQSTTWIVNSVGSAGSPASQTRKCTNAKWKSNTTVELSGLPKGPGTVLITKVNKFFASALHSYPSFPQQSSGTLMIEYTASGTSKVNTYNAKLYAYKADGALTDAPPDIVVKGFEINASGQWYAGQSGVWVDIAGQNSPLYFTNHSPTNKWLAQHKHLWVAALSIKPNSIGLLDDFNWAFQFQYA